MAADGLSVACAGCVTSAQIQTVQGSQVTGSIAGSQIIGTIPTDSVPPGSDNYIQNGTTLQPMSNFNISGSGTAGECCRPRSTTLARLLRWGIQDFRISLLASAREQTTLAFKTRSSGLTQD